MRGGHQRFNFLSMTHCSLLRVIVFVPPLLWACAHEVDDYPEALGADDSSVVGKSGAGGEAIALSDAAGTDGGNVSSQSGGTAGTASRPPSGGTAGKTSGG